MPCRSKAVALHPIRGYVIRPQEELKTSKRNSRERNRVESVNRGFDTLRQHVPRAARVKRLSKVQILQHAMEYIQALGHLLGEEQGQQLLPPSSYMEQSSCHRAPSSYNTQGCPPSSYPPPLTYHGESGYETCSYFSDNQPSPSLPPTWPHTAPLSLPTTAPLSLHSTAPLSLPSTAPLTLPISLPTTAPLFLPSTAPLPLPSEFYSPPPPSFPVKQEQPDSTTGLKREKRELEGGSKDMREVEVWNNSAKGRELDGESSGEEDDVLDAIAEWQQD